MLTMEHETARHAWSDFSRDELLALLHHLHESCRFRLPLDQADILQAQHDAAIAASRRAQEAEDVAWKRQHEAHKALTARYRPATMRAAAEADDTHRRARRKVEKARKREKDLWQQLEKAWEARRQIYE